MAKTKPKKKPESSRREKRFDANALFTNSLTNPERAVLKRLARLPDSKIDLSDAPEAAPSKLHVGRFYRPVKQLISPRVDADVVAWYKAQGPKYQTHMNQVLRREAEGAGNRG